PEPAARDLPPHRLVERAVLREAGAESPDAPDSPPRRPLASLDEPHELVAELLLETGRNVLEARREPPLLRRLLPRNPFSSGLSDEVIPDAMQDLLLVPLSDPARD